MKLKSLFIKTIAIGAVASLAVNCHAKKVEDNPLLFFALSNTITGLAQGNCAISVNWSAKSWDTVVQLAVSGSAEAAAASTFRIHFNNFHGMTLTNAELAGQPYNVKYDTYFTDKDTWNDATRSTHLQAVKTAIEANLFNPALPAATFTALKGGSGVGILVCARIPKTSCSLGGATTGSLEGDLASAKNTYDAIYENSDCRKTDVLLNTLKTNIFKGAPPTQVNLASGPYTNAYTNGDTSSVGTSQAILGAKMYPKFGAIIPLNFGSFMPMRTGTTAYSLTGGTAYVPGANIAFTNVASCESIGMGGTGILVGGTTPLTTVQEVAYKLSTNGSAADAYNTAAGAGTNATNCNNSFRAKSPISLLLGGGKLGSVNGGTGDGGVSSLLTACLYGGNATSRGTTTATLATSAVANIASCPAAAAAGAAKFGDVGLTNLANFPND